MSTEPYRPKTVGDVGIYVVGVEGVITEMTDGTITIGGHKLPLRTSDTVKYLSVVWPEDGEECSRAHCTPDCDVNTSCGCDPDEGHTVESLLEIIRDHHNAIHPGAFPTCSWTLCKEVQR